MPSLQPTLWLSEEDETFAKNFFSENRLDRDHTIGLFIGAQNAIRIYPFYAKALTRVCKEYHLNVIAFGSSSEAELNAKCLGKIGVDVINLCGKTRLRQTAALLKRCRLGIGAETGTAHMACAVGTPNVVLIGGGHFGRFMPYSPLSYLACLPLSCYGCNWQCQYLAPHCIQGVEPTVLEQAVRAALEQHRPGPHVFIQSADDWKPSAGGPLWKWPASNCAIDGAATLVVCANPSRKDTSQDLKPDMAPDQGRVNAKECGLASTSTLSSRSLVAGSAQDPAELRRLQFDFSEFLQRGPQLTQRLGESEDCYEQMDRFTAMLHQAVEQQPQSPDWQKLALLYAEKANFQPLYFSRRNLKPIAVRRAAIVDYATRLKRHDLEYALPPRSRGSARIRLGIYSWSLRPHTETFATLPIFAHLDPQQFEVRVYIHQGDGNPVEQRVRRLAKSVAILPETLKACVETIRADDLDILVFGNNITAGGVYAFSLANYRMARVQCIHFCNPVTSGKRNVDCFLLGKVIAENLDAAEHFSEKILILEGSGICFDLPDQPAEAGRAYSRQDFGIPESSTVFISGANYFKIIPELRHTWAKILAQVPGSVLLLYPFGPAWSQHYPQQQLLDGITRVFDQYGIPSERLIVMDTLKGRGDILALNRIADIYLDALPYNGATSLLDPLQEAVPPVVVDGRELRFAQGAAILRELGAPELIAGDEEGYIRLAMRLATDCGMREATRRLIREQMGRTPPFLNPRLYATRVSRAFRSLFPDVRPQLRPEASSQHASLILPG